MGRINLTTILTWLILSAALIFAFVFGTYQWQRYQTAQLERQQTSRNLAVQQRNTIELRSQFKDLTKRVASADTPREDPEFYAQLKRLMDVSGVRPASIVPATPAALPTIGTAQTGKPAGTVNATTPSNAPKKDANGKDIAPVGYSLTSLPLNIRPLSTTLVVAGSFASINTFVRNLYNFRFGGGSLHYGAPRAININSLQITGADATTGQLRATLLLTRFVYKPDAAPKPPQAK